jgi:hypothetical protein
MNRKLTKAVYISTIILIGSISAAACAVFVPVDTGPPTEVSRTTTTTETNVPDPTVTTQKTTVTQTSAY